MIPLGILSVGRHVVHKRLKLYTSILLVGSGRGEGKAVTGFSGSLEISFCADKTVKKI